MDSMNTRLNIEKLDGNIVQKHGGSKQVGFKQLGPGVETGVHEVSNNDTAVAQRRLEDKQPEEKTNTDFLVKEQEKEYQTGWKNKMGNVLNFYNQRSTQQCMKSRFAKNLGVAGIQQQNGLVDETNVTLFAKNMGFSESGEYKKTFIGSGVGTSLMQVLHGFEFEVEPLGDHTFKVKPQEHVDQGAGLQEVQTQDLMDYQLPCDRDQHLPCELFGYREDSNEAAFAVAAVEKIYAHESLTLIIQLLVSDDNDGYYLEYTPDKAKGNVLGMEIIRDQSGNTLRVLQSRFYNGKLVQTLLEGYSILSLEGSLSGDCDVEKNGSLKSNLQYMEAMSTTEAGYITFTEA
ncbi:hypothetical protein Tco_1569244 [Tanacetum coccineum]